MINANPQQAMFAEFHRIMASKEANKEKYAMFEAQLAQSEQDLYDGFWGGLILEFAPHKITAEIEQAKREGAMPMMMPMSVDPVLVAFGSGQQVKEEVLVNTRKRFSLPEPTIKSALDEFTLYQLNAYKEQQ